MSRAAAVVIASTVLAGCGSSGHESSPPSPKLPAQPAAQLAQESDQVAATLDAGDACGALAKARQLQTDTIRLINAGQVPGPFQEQLGSAVTDLVGRIRCVPSPPAYQGHGEGNGHGKHQGKQGEGD